MVEYILDIENEFEGWKPDEEEILEKTKKIFSHYLATPEVYDNSCLAGQEYETVSFDFLFCDGEKTHVINRDYRNKDYSADIITFAVFADSPDEEKFVLDMEINLGEVIIGLDRVIDEAEKKGVTKEVELLFLISHGIMHLLGFDHQTQEDFDFVVAHQKKALESIGIIYDKI